MTVLPKQPVVNLYGAPDPAAELVSQLLLGTPARIAEERGGWWRVSGPDGYPGWAEPADFAPCADPEGWRSGDRARIAVLYANVRHAPSRRSGPLVCAPLGVTLPVLERLDEWVGLHLPGGRTGWLESTRVEPASSRPAEVDRLLDTARQLLGVPYLWGGISSFGIDCSGLVQAVFGLHGLALPRDAHDQAAFGQPVSRDRLAPGDLVYFAPSPDGPRETITHVAIALGADRILHALGGRAVVETAIEDGGAFWGARRIG